MTERTKALKFKKTPVAVKRLAVLRKQLKDECRAQFVFWAEGTILDVGGIHSG